MQRLITIATSASRGTILIEFKSQKRNPIILDSVATLALNEFKISFRLL